MVKVIVADKQYDCEHLLGTFLDESHYDVLVTEDTDFYAPSNGIDGDTSENRVVFKYRKNFFNQQEMDSAYQGLRAAAGISQNRGLAAGPRGEKQIGREWVTDYQFEMLEYFCDPYDTLDGSDPVEDIKTKFANGGKSDDQRGMVWLTSKTGDGFDFEKLVEELRGLPKSEQVKRAKHVVETCISKTSYANAVHSGIAGSFSRYPRIPYGRMTSYSENNWDMYEKSFPFLQSLSKSFAEFLPEKYASQKAFTDKLDPKFVVPGTCFTTITVNKTFRTAAHRDAGDLSSGFSNLCVLTNGKKYSGGYLILPEFRAAVAIGPGDLLLVGNHDWIHGNTPIVLDDPEAERVSLVCYAREDMNQCGEFEYEMYRREFIDSRRLNKEHPLWKPLWNGVSAGWETSDEWKQFLLKHERGQIWIDKYHPDFNSSSPVSLDEFF